MKPNNCERCGREINHKGRCLPCNYLYKHHAWFAGLRESRDYDDSHGMNVQLVSKIVAEKKSSIKPQPKIPPDLKIDTDGKRKCLRCFCPIEGKYLYCLSCYRFINNWAHIKSYQQFLDIFELDDTVESKDNYIEFVDDMNKFFDLQDFSIEGILDNPGKYLEKLEGKPEKENC